ncbi:hypothetical protein [Bdellovibrio sp. HCB2-146]|uniref:hypothetical protein n=1 Tax=Bdellovibrio sp. HCB2-146 TaxID=3394362 RepID=UPI0039BD14FE
MMRILKYFVCGIFVASTALSPSVSFGDAIAVSGEKETATQPKGNPLSGAGAGTPAVNDSANKAGDANSKGQMMSMLVGTALTVAGTSMVSSSNPPTVAAGVVLLGMGILSFMQGGAHGKTAGTAGLTSNQSDGYNDLYETGGGISDPTIAKETQVGQNTLKNLEKSGVYNPKTGTLKVGGKTYKTSDFASKEAMAAAGFPSGLIDGAYAYAEKAAARAEAKVSKVKLGAMTEANGYADAGGGSGGGSASTASATDPYAGGMGGAGMGAGSGMGGHDRDPSSLAGMQKNYNGEPIGVSADSIFLMMTRRYKVKESQESFYSDSDLALKK